VTLLVTLVLGAGLAVVWVRVVQTLKETPTGLGTIGQPGALVWDGRVFTSPAQLKSYLAARGLSYKTWAARHPTAFGGEAPARATTSKPTKTATKTTTTTASKPKPHAVAVPSVSVSESRPLVSTVLTVLLLLGGVALGASAVLPPRLVPETVRNFYYAQPDRRTVALAAATAILLGFGVSFYLA
jgi:hypothetical protein